MDYNLTAVVVEVNRLLYDYGDTNPGIIRMCQRMREAGKIHFDKRELIC